MSKPTVKKVYFTPHINGGDFLDARQLKAMNRVSFGYRPMSAALNANKPFSNTISSASNIKAKVASSGNTIQNVFSVTSGEDCPSCKKNRNKRKRLA